MICCCTVGRCQADNQLWVGDVGYSARSWAAARWDDTCCELEIIECIL